MEKTRDVLSTNYNCNNYHNWAALKSQREFGIDLYRTE